MIHEHEQPENPELREWSHRQKDFHESMSITKTRIFLREAEEKRRRKRKKITLWRIFGIIAIALLIFTDVKIASHQSIYKYRNVLQSLNGEDPLYQSVNNYVHYLAGRAAQHGKSGLEGKWLEDIPKDFDNDGAVKLRTLGQQNFIVENISADKENVFHVKCHPLESLADTIELDVIKVKVKNDFIFRLLRVY